MACSESRIWRNSSTVHRRLIFCYLSYPSVVQNLHKRYTFHACDFEEIIRKLHSLSQTELSNLSGEFDLTKEETELERWSLFQDDDNNLLVN